MFFSTASSTALITICMAHRRGSRSVSAICVAAIRKVWSTLRQVTNQIKSGWLFNLRGQNPSISVGCATCSLSGYSGKFEEVWRRIPRLRKRAAFIEIQIGHEGCLDCYPLKLKSLKTSIERSKRCAQPCAPPICSANCPTNAPVTFNPFNAGVRSCGSSQMP